MSLSSGAWAARHEAATQDPTGTAKVSAWVDEGDGRLRQGQDVTVQPASPDGPAPGPIANFLPFFEALIPVPQDPDSWYVPPVEGPDLGPDAHLPDLTPLPAWAVYLDESNIGTTVGDFALATAQGEDPFGGSEKAIRFGVTISNIGRHSLEVIGIPQPTDDEDHVRVDARQCVRFAGVRIAGGARVCQEYRPVGNLIFHPQHGHFHIDGFAQYRLLKDVGGKPGPSLVVSRAEKVGFCMGDTDWLGRGAMVADTGWYRECRHTAPNVPVTVRQGVSPGWGDSYGPGLPGQHLVIKGIPDGVYWISVTVNPGGKGAVSISETTRANNTSYRKIELRKGGTELKVY